MIDPYEEGEKDMAPVESEAGPKPVGMGGGKIGESHCSIPMVSCKARARILSPFIQLCHNFELSLNKQP